MKSKKTKTPKEETSKKEKKQEVTPIVIPAEIGTIDLGELHEQGHDISEFLDPYHFYD